MISCIRDVSQRSKIYALFGRFALSLRMSGGGNEL